MTIGYFVVVGLIMGVVFGTALEKSRVFEPGMMIGQMQLTNFVLIRVFLSAIATGLVVLAILHGTGVVALHPKAFDPAAVIVGGLLLGAGIVIAGACPGTVLAQIGAGYRDALGTLAGGILGAMAYGYALPVLDPVFFTDGLGKPTLDQWLGFSFGGLALAFAAVLVVALAALERWRPWRSELGADYDGVGMDEPSSGGEPGAAPGGRPAKA